MLGKHGAAAILHDYLYRSAAWRLRQWWGIVPNARNARHAADRVFLEAMGVLHVGRVKRHLMFAAVRAFGWHAWRRNREDLM
jgi:hypothetical protein